MAHTLTHSHTQMGEGGERQSGEKKKMTKDSKPRESEGKIKKNCVDCISVEQKNTDKRGEEQKHTHTHTQLLVIISVEAEQLLWSQSGGSAAFLSYGTSHQKYQFGLI